MELLVAAEPGDAGEVVAGVGVDRADVDTSRFHALSAGNTVQLPSEPFWAHEPPVGGAAVVVVGRSAPVLSWRGTVGSPGDRCRRAEARGQHQRPQRHGHQEERAAAHGVLSASRVEILEGGRPYDDRPMSGRGPSSARSPARRDGNLGPFHMYGIILAVGVLVAVYVAEQRWRGAATRRTGSTTSRSGS